MAAGDDAGAGAPEKVGACRAFVQEVLCNVRRAAKENRVSAVISFLVGVALIALYELGGPDVRRVFEALERAQAHGGVPASMFSTGLFGGVLPTALQAALGTLRTPRAAHAAYNTALWVLLGAAVNELYAFQARLFGDGGDFRTVACKVFVDQFIWNPFMCVPFLLATLRWQDRGFATKDCRAMWQPRSVLATYCSMMIATWVTWIPGTSVVYMFPPALQMPMFNIILFMFAILLALLTSSAADAPQRDLELAEALQAPAA